MFALKTRRTVLDSMAPCCSDVRRISSGPDRDVRAPIQLSLHLCSTCPREESVGQGENLAGWSKKNEGLSRLASPAYCVPASPKEAADPDYMLNPCRDEQHDRDVLRCLRDRVVHTSEPRTFLAKNRLACTLATVPRPLGEGRPRESFRFL